MTTLKSLETVQMRKNDPRSGGKSPMTERMLKAKVVQTWMVKDGMLE